MTDSFVSSVHETAHMDQQSKIKNQLVASQQDRQKQFLQLVDQCFQICIELAEEQKDGPIMRIDEREKKLEDANIKILSTVIESMATPSNFK